MSSEQRRLWSVWNQLSLHEQLHQLHSDPSLSWQWPLWARESQLAPEGDWTYWLILAGRGFGKTRTGAEWVRQEVKTSSYVNLIGATADDARDIMVEGESGILAICPRHERPEYKSSQRKLVWPNGAVSLIFTADEPERLRGKQHSRLWGDELAAWRYPEAWDQAKFGLRLGAKPRACLTTTPKPTPLVKKLIADAATHTTRGTTYQNKENLAETFFTQIVSTYEGTRLGRQELNAEVLDDNPNALWQRSQIDALRVPRDKVPRLTRVVVGVDPAVTSNEDSDLTGIVVVGLGSDGHAYVLEDCSLIASPNAWARRAVKAYHDHGADRLIAETNNGGDLVESLIRSVDPNVSYRKVTATRGKVIRAEPVAALYEQGRVHHAAPGLEALEDRLCEFDPINTVKSPDRMDALVWACTNLFEQDFTGMLGYVGAQVQALKDAKNNG